MNRKKIIFILIILISLSSLPPLLLPNNINNIIISTSTILGALISIITLAIAFILYNKFGIDESVYNKRTEVILALLKTIRGKKFWIETKGLKIQVPLSVIDKDRARFEIFENVHLLFSQSYYDFIDDIFEAASDFYMPEEIAQRIKELQPSFLSFPKNINAENLGKIMVPGMHDTITWGFVDNKQVRLKDFISKWIDLIEIIEAWIKKNSSKENLNL